MRKTLLCAGLVGLLLAGCGETPAEAPAEDGAQAAAEPEMDALTSQLVNDPFGRLGGEGTVFVSSDIKEDAEGKFAGSITMRAADGTEQAYACTGSVFDGMAQETKCEPKAAAEPAAEEAPTAAQ